MDSVASRQKLTDDYAYGLQKYHEDRSELQASLWFLLRDFGVRQIKEPTQHVALLSAPTRIRFARMQW